jgi:hypothetical protein
MPAATQPQPPPFEVPIAGPGGIVADVWRRYFLDTTTATFNAVNANTAAINAIPGVNVWPLASQPSLGVSDAGYLAFVSDYRHFVRWSGTLWTFAPGDVGNGFFRPYAVVPQEGAWALCDGSVTDYLVVRAAALSVASFTLPNLLGTPAYLKAAAAYTGTINAASGSTGTGTSGGGTTGTESAHTHNVPAQLGVISSNQSGLAVVVTAGAIAASDRPHTHTTDIPAQTSGAGSAHSHSVPGLSVPALDVGSIDMANLGVPIWFRRRQRPMVWMDWVL